MSRTRLPALALSALLVGTSALGLAGCSGSEDSGDSGDSGGSSGSSGSAGSGDGSGGPVEVAGVGDAFTFERFAVAEGWTVRPVEHSAGMESVTSPEISGEVTNEGDEPAYALFEMVFGRDGQPIATVKCSSKEIAPGATVDLLCPGLGMPMPDGHDEIVVQELTR